MIEPRTIEFDPKNDITSYEVAKCLEIVISIFSWYSRMTFEDAKKIVLSNPVNISRHFKIKE